MSTRYRLSTFALVVAAVLALVSAAPAQTTPQTNTFAVDGAVSTPLTLTTADLRRYPARYERVRFESGTGTQRHSYVGARLFDVLNAAGPQFDPAIKNNKLTFAVLVTATDNYQSVVAWAEF